MSSCQFCSSSNPLEGWDRALPRTGMTSTAAKLVCRAAFGWKGDCLTRRCVPFSPDRYPYAKRPCTSISTFLTPASSPAVGTHEPSRCLPCLSMQRLLVYTRDNEVSLAKCQPCILLIMVALKPCLSAQRKYMRSSISAQSIASTPPAPACACVSITAMGELLPGAVQFIARISHNMH